MKGAFEKAVIIKSSIEVTMADQGSGGNVIAAICNIFFPGLGQLVQGRLFAAILFFVFWLVSGALVWVLVGWVLLPIVYLWSIIDAARYRSPSRYEER